MIFRMTFGNLTTLGHTESWTHHIEWYLADERQHIFSDGNALNMTDGMATSLIAGNATEEEYRE